VIVVFVALCCCWRCVVVGVFVGVAAARWLLVLPHCGVVVVVVASLLLVLSSFVANVVVAQCFCWSCRGVWLVMVVPWRVVGGGRAAACGWWWSCRGGWLVVVVPRRGSWRCGIVVVAAAFLLLLRCCFCCFCGAVFVGLVVVFVQLLCVVCCCIGVVVSYAAWWLLPRRCILVVVGAFYFVAAAWALWLQHCCCCRGHALALCLHRRWRYLLPVLQWCHFLSQSESSAFLRNGVRNSTFLFLFLFVYK